MESVNTLLETLVNIFSLSSTDLWLKVTVSIITVFGFVFRVYLKQKARKEAAKRERDRDIQQDMRDNVNTEDQNSQDGAEVRERLRRNKDG